MDGWAEFSNDGAYRYLLGRRVSDSRRRLLFVMLNPGTADEVLNDPTIRRCIGFAKRWNFGMLEVANLFAFRTSYVAELRRAENPIGPGNDLWIGRALESADRVVLAWGNHGSYLGRSREVRQTVFERAQPYHFGRNKSGEPRHPLYLPSAATIRRMETDIAMD